MPRKPAIARDKLRREGLRLLRALAAGGASAGRTDLREGFVAVSAPKNGVSAILASTPIAAGDELVARDLAVWTDGPHGKRLALLPEGRAFARRHAAADADPFAAQHRSVVVRSVAQGGAPVMIDERESPLAWLARRKGRDGAAFLSVAQIEAGQRFSHDVIAAQLLPRITSDWSGMASSGARGPQNLNVSDLAITARRRLDRAAGAIGPELYGLLVDICGFQKALELVERERLWPSRAAKLVLRVALDRLAAHYGLSSVAQGPARSPDVRRWGATDYRPFIDPPE